MFILRHHLLEVRRLRSSNLLDPVSRGWIVLASGNVARLALGLISSVLVARAFGPAGLGLYSVLGAFVFIAGAVCDLGLSDAAVRSIAANIDISPTKAAENARVFVWIKVGAALTLVAFGILFSAPISQVLLGAENGPWLSFALLGVAATALVSSLGSILQGLRRFSRLTFISLLNTVLTAIAAMALFAAGQLNIATALVFLGAGTTLLTFFFGIRLLPLPWQPFRQASIFSIPSRSALLTEGRQLFRFGRWLWLSNIFIMLTGYLDLILVNHWSAPEVVGIYALALNLTGKVDVVNSSLYTVLLPAASALKGEMALRHYVREGLRRSALISLTLLPILILSQPFISILYGNAFEPALSLFRIMLGLVLIDLFAWPLLLLAYPYNEPKLLAEADALRTVIMVGVAVALIPIYGPIGAVVAKFLAKISGALFTLVSIRRLRQSKRLDVAL